MRFLAWHVDYVTATPTESGRSAIVESAEPVHAENALLLFVNFEKSDEAKQAAVVSNAINEIISINTQLKVNSIVLNPFAHLFAEPCSLDAAKSMLNALYDGLAAKQIDVKKLAFGMFYELELKAKGHRLSRISRIIN